MSKENKVGDKVMVKTKHYGEKIGIIKKIYPNREWPQKNEFLIEADAHPRYISALVQDIYTIKR